MSNELSPLEKVSPLVIESFLRNSSSSDEGNYLDEGTRQFLATNCPRFENFSVLVDENASSVTGKGLDVQMFVVHKEYCEVIESTIVAYLKDINVSADRFRLACARILATTDAEDNTNRNAVRNLVSFIDQYQDFFAFGHMMERYFLRLHPSQKLSVTGTEGVQLSLHQPSEQPIKQNAETNSALITSPSAMFPVAISAAASFKAVRVLWDIENISVSKRLGGVETVKRLSTFLRAHHLSGAGIDVRITVFFNPSKLSDSVVRELDAASVELVWISAKQEDADRKLVSRISQEMAVLPASHTCFVLITSDKDFRSQLQMLSAAGYHTVVLHDATHDDWRKSLEMHASQAYSWRKEVLGENNVEGGGGGRDEAGPSKHRREIERAAASQEAAGPQKLFQDFLNEFGISTDKNDSSVVSDALPVGEDEVEVRLATGGTSVMKKARLFAASGQEKFLAACALRWKGPFGFLVVPVPKTADEIASESVKALAPVHNDRSANGASSTENLEACRKALGIDDTQSPSLHLVKVFAHHSALQFNPPRSFLSRGDVCEVSLGPNPKGIVAIKVINKL